VVFMFVCLFVCLCGVFLGRRQHNRLILFLILFLVAVNPGRVYSIFKILSTWFQPKVKNSLRV
jgi:hypothetical protein